MWAAQPIAHFLATAEPRSRGRRSELLGEVSSLYDLVVSPEHRRRGIGAGLVRELEKICRADGVTRVWVGTALDNHAARRTFEVTGARKVSEAYAEYVYDLDDGRAV